MKSKKATKRALLSSALSLVLCFSMLLGTTFAWFTDTAKTGVNTIQSGTLEVKLMGKADDGTYTYDLEGKDFQFKNTEKETNILWEPGVTFVTDGFQIQNHGNLALKYKMIVNGVTGGNAKLLDVIDFYVTTTDPATYNSGSEFYNNDTAKVKLEDFADKYNYLAPKGTSSLEIKGETVSDKTATYYLVGHMDENANNDYQNESITGVGITVYATQVESEVDSFDNKYDGGAYILPTVYNAAELASALEQGKSVQLGNDIELTETLTIPEGVTVTLDLNGKTINAGWADENAGKHIYAIDNKGDLTITGNGTINARGNYNHGKLTLENGTINAVDGNGGYAVRSLAGAKFIMNGGTIATTLEDDNKVDEGGYDATTVRVDYDAEFIMNGGEINNICDFTFAIDNYGTTTVENGEISSVHTTVANYGTMTINGGEFTCNGLEGITAHAVWAAGGTTTINGGTFDGKDNFNGFNVDASASATVNITGGNFLLVHSGSLYGEGTIAVSGGTFFDDPSARVATGYQAVKSNGTYYVLKGDAVANNTTALNQAIADGKTEIALAPGEYTLPSVTGKSITLVGLGPETVVDYSHMGGYQEVSGSSFVFKNMTVVNAEAGYPYKGLQHITSVSYEDCHITGTVNLFAPATFTNCTFDSKSAEHNVVTYGSDSVTFTDCEFTYGDRAVNCYAENASARDVKVSFTGCTFTKVAGKETTGAIETNSSLMKSLTLTINNCTVNEGELWFIAGWDSKGGANTTVTVDGVASKGDVLVQSGVLPYLTLNSNSTYKLVGDFDGKNVALTMPAGVENVIFDGSNATNINELIIIQNGTLIDNANDVVGERSGNVTVQNFNVLSQINVFACKTEVVVQKNTAEALMVHAGNCDVKVLNNTIDANFESHPTYCNETTTWNTNDYGIALNIFEYNLWLDGNTVTNAKSHVIGINGWEGTFDTGVDNVIKSFKGNTITVNSTVKTDRAAFKVWDDETYASNDDATDVVNATAQAFINDVLTDGSNTFNITEGYDHTIFCFYNVNTNN